MLTPPPDLSEAALAQVLGTSWGVVAASVEYRAVGAGSHHWQVTAVAGERWFVTVDDLEARRRSAAEPWETAFARLRAALATATALRDSGRPFVVAPVVTADGEPLAPVDGRFGVALYPLVEGESFAWGAFSGAAHRLAVLDMLVGVHTAPPAVTGVALVDDFDLPHRDELEATLRRPEDIDPVGPYARATAELVAGQAGPIGRLLSRYDGLVAEARTRPDRMVLTHGEPHPGNTMRTPEGWRLIDWDTALVAPPERDLWDLDPGDGSVFAAYVAATGIMPLPPMVELHRIRWDLADLAVYVGRFRRPHGREADDEAAWAVLQPLVARLAR